MADKTIIAIIISAVAIVILIAIAYACISQHDDQPSHEDEQNMKDIKNMTYHEMKKLKNK